MTDGSAKKRESIKIGGPGLLFSNRGPQLHAFRSLPSDMYQQFNAKLVNIRLNFDLLLLNFAKHLLLPNFVKFRSGLCMYFKHKNELFTTYFIPKIYSQPCKNDFNFKKMFSHIFKNNK